MRLTFLLLLFALLATGCRTPGRPGPAPVEIVLPPAATRGEFTIEADKLDTWNAVGQIAVRTRQAAECEAGAGRKKGKRS